MRGLGWAQLACFVLFFAGLIAFVGGTVGPLSTLQLWSVASLGALTPIVGHVNLKIWIDNPKLAFATAGAAAFVWSVRRDSMVLAAGAAALLVTSVLVKLDSALMLLPLVGLAAAVFGREHGRFLARASVLVLGVCAIGIAIWIACNLIASGHLLSGAAGRPIEAFQGTNPFLRAVTSGRPAWIYWVLVPAVMPTVAVSFVSVGRRGLRGSVSGSEGAAVAWIVVFLAAYTILGLLGYSKLLRYVGLIVPATVLLFSEALGRLERAWEETRRPRAALLLGLALLSLLLECAQGLKTMLFHFNFAFIEWWF